MDFISYKPEGNTAIDNSNFLNYDKQKPSWNHYCFNQQEIPEVFLLLKSSIELFLNSYLSKPLSYR